MGRSERGHRPRVLARPSSVCISHLGYFCPMPARSLRHSTLIPPLSLLRTTESIRPDSFGVNGQGPNSIGLIFA